MPAMRIVLAGGTGQVGAILARHYHAAGHHVTVLSRNPTHKSPWTEVAWDANSQGAWSDTLNGSDCVINLAGRSVNCRYTTENRRLIMTSRVNATRAIGQAIAAAPSPPPLWLQSSTATIYSHRFDAPNDDIDGKIGGGDPGKPSSWDFSIGVARAWEAAAMEHNLPHTRRVLMRSAMVMSPDVGGIFDTLYTLVRRGLGGTAGSGRQYVSWVHEYDFIAAVQWLIQHPQLEGPINIASPNPLPYSDFMKILRREARMPIGLPATKLMLEAGAIFMRTETELVLKSRRVVPRILLDSGFSFQLPTWDAAAADLCERRRTRSDRTAA